MTLRPRRSALYMPGSNARALEKARALPADVLILDLEDAVAPNDKALGRERIAAAVTEGGYGRRELIIRVNGLDTEWGEEDVRVIAALPIDGVLFPKVESADDVDAASKALDEAGAATDLPIWTMAETPRGILNLDSVARANPRIACIVAGTSDLSKDMRVPHTPNRLGFLVPLTHCVLAARANGLDVLDGVHLNFKDLEEFRIHCEQGRELGFDGKTLIHPSQIACTNQVFAPAEDDIASARAILVAWDAAQAAGKGLVVLDGRLVENLHVEEAKRTLALAEGIAALTAATDS